MNRTFLLCTLFSLKILCSCKKTEEINSTKENETEVYINDDESTNLYEKFLEKCCCCCTVDDLSIQNYNYLADFDSFFYFQENSVQNISSNTIFSTNYTTPHIKYYYSRYELNKKEKLYIKFSMFLEKDLENEDLFFNPSKDSKFSTFINEMFKKKQFTFYIINTLTKRSEKNINFIKFVLQPKVIDFLKKERKTWKNLGYKILDEPNLYAEFPLIPRLGMGVCPINQKKLMLETHLCLFFPSVIDNKFLELDYLTSKIEKFLDEKSKKEFNKKYLITDYMPQYTIASLNEDNERRLYGKIDNRLYPFYNDSNRKKTKYINTISYAPLVDIENINLMIEYFLINNSNKWGLVCTEAVNHNHKIPHNYKKPNVIEAIFIMLYSIKNDINSILSYGIKTGTQGEKIGHYYVVEYIKDSNSININLKPTLTEDKYFLIRENCGERTIKKTGYQKLFTDSTVDICCFCPTYCCYNSVLLKNPFCCCSSSLKRCTTIEHCMCLAISGICIYPTSDSFCQRCTSLSLSENGVCCLNCFCKSICISTLCAGFLFTYLY